MLRIFIEPSKFTILPIQNNQNPYIDIDSKLHNQTIVKQHNLLRKAFRHSPQFLGVLPKYSANPLGKSFRHAPKLLDKHSDNLPDIVFCANGGLSLPRLSGTVMLLPNMKYEQRRAELPYLKKIFNDFGIPTIDYPGTEVFEGQAELKWFDGGKKAVCGYGYRSTKRTFTELNDFFKQIYGAEAPELLVLKLMSPNYYHLDIAMLEFQDSKCIIHEQAFSANSIQKLQKFLGKENVFIINTPDLFCLNSVIDGKNLITHKLTDPSLKPLLERITGLSVMQVDTSEFEKSGGSVRCMTLDVPLQA